ncbi:MAG: hypothetical protein U0872_01570 [Planctomycetaceae bacterium]
MAPVLIILGPWSLIEREPHERPSHLPWYLLLAEYLSHASDDYQARRKQIDVESQKGNKLMAQARRHRNRRAEISTRVLPQP